MDSSEEYSNRSIHKNFFSWSMNGSVDHSTYINSYNNIIFRKHRDLLNMEEKPFKIFDNKLWIGYCFNNHPIWICLICRKSYVNENLNWDINLNIMTFQILNNIHAGKEFCLGLSNRTIYFISFHFINVKRFRIGLRHIAYIIKNYWLHL